MPYGDLLTQFYKKKDATKEQQVFERVTLEDVRYTHRDNDELIDQAPQIRSQFQQREYSSLSKDEKKKAKKEHKLLQSKSTFVLQSDMDSAYMRHVLETEKDGYKQSELLEEARHGNCCRLQKLDPVLRNRAATEYMMKTEVQQLLLGPIEQVIPRLKALSVSQMMNPLLRIGISCVMNDENADPQVVEKYRQIDEFLNTQIMIETIAKQKPTDYTPDKGRRDEEWARNEASQRFMFKTMLACQLGGLKKISQGGPPTDWSGSVANAFTHCSRVMITLPGGAAGTYDQEKQKKMFESFHGKAGFKKRGGATHTMSRKRKGSVSGAVEKKFFSPRSQYGMNVAVGGLDNEGIPAGTNARLLKNDGSCGHLFMHFEEGTKDKHAGMLLGFESDAYGVVNQTGHVHDLKATGEFASSFGGQRCDEIGDKYGGRVVDLSGVSEDAFTQVMELAEKATKAIQDGTSALTNITMRDLAESVCGGLMDKAGLKELIRTLYGVAGEATNSVNKAENIVKAFGF